MVEGNALQKFADKYGELENTKELYGAVVKIEAAKNKAREIMRDKHNIEPDEIEDMINTGQYLGFLEEDGITDAAGSLEELVKDEKFDEFLSNIPSKLLEESLEEYAPLASPGYEEFADAHRTVLKDDKIKALREHYTAKYKVGKDHPNSKRLNEIGDLFLNMYTKNSDPEVINRRYQIMNKEKVKYFLEKKDEEGFLAGYISKIIPGDKKVAYASNMVDKLIKAQKAQGSNLALGA
ncbi:hypothetical protein CMI42_01440 [Candidatus Pacearchaeota archaeon]|nr:hypothetical protein [Candidatus Pacearchaeota archaeon]|tara:strand:+ start:132 stop:842 length:711 start_codon:yes stop_codon:yes gene_type:complete